MVALSEPRENQYEEPGVISIGSVLEIVAIGNPAVWLNSLCNHLLNHWVELVMVSPRFEHGPGNENGIPPAAVIEGTLIRHAVVKVVKFHILVALSNRLSYVIVEDVRPSLLEVLESQQAEKGRDGVSSEATALLSEMENLMNKGENIAWRFLGTFNLFNCNVGRFGKPELPNIGSQLKNCLVMSEIGESC